MRRLAFGLLLCSLLLGLCYSQRDWLLLPGLKSWVSKMALDEFGAELEIVDVQGSWLGGLELCAVRWKASDSPLLALTGGRLAAEYSLSKLLFGGLPELELLELSASSVDLDLGRLPAGDASTEAFVEGARLPNLNRFQLDLKQVSLRGLGSSAALVLDQVLIEGKLVAGRLFVKHCSLRRGADHFSLSELNVDLEQGSFSTLLERMSAQLRIELQRPEELWAQGPLPSGLSLDWEGSIARGQLSLTGELRMDGGLLRLERGGLTLPNSSEGGRGEWWRGVLLDLDMVAEFEDLAPLRPLLGEDLQGALSGSLQLRGTLGEPQGLARGEVQRFQYQNYQVDALELDLEAQRGRLLLRSLAAKDEHFVAQVKGLLELDPPVFDYLSIGFKSADLAQAQAAWPTLKDVEFGAELRGPIAALQGSYQLQSGALELGSLQLLSLNSHGAFDADGLSIANLSAVSETGSIQAMGHLAPMGAARQAALGLTSNHFELNLEQFSASSFGLSCSLAEPQRAILGSELISIEKLRLLSAGGEARLDLQQDARGMRVDLSVVDFDPDPLLEIWLDGHPNLGRLAGSLSLLLPPAELGQPALKAQLTGRALVPLAGGTSWDWELDATYANALLEVRRLAAHAELGAGLELSLKAPVDLAASDWMSAGDVDLELKLKDLELEQHLKGLLPVLHGGQGKLNALISATGSWGELGLQARGNLSELRAPAQWLDLGGRLHKLGFQLEAGKQAGSSSLKLEGAIQADFAGELDWDGDLRALLAKPSAWQALSLHTQGKLKLADLAWLAKWSPITRGAEGELEAELKLAGALHELAVSGTATLRRGAMRLSSELPPLRELELKLEMDESYALGLSGSAEMGGAPLALAGSIELGGAQPSIDLRLQGENLLLVRNAELRLRAAVDLVLRGPLDRLRVSGDVELSEGRFVRNMDLLNGLLSRSRGESTQAPGIGLSLAHEGPLASAEFDVKLSAKTAFRVDSNLAQVFLRPELTLGGTGEVPIFIGSIYIAPSKLSLPSGKLNIRSGQIEFLPGDPFEPRLTIQADMNAQGYRVQSTIAGTLSQPEIVLSSEPGLPNDELMLLFLTGRRPAGTSDQALQSVAIYLANDFLTSWLFEKDADSAESLAERFEYEVGASLSRAGATTGRATFLLHKRLEGPGRSQFLVAERDEFDHLNYGFGVLFRFR